jgi:hypothetical protein
MSDNQRTVRITLDVAYNCGPLGFTVTDKYRLFAAIRGGIERAGVAKEITINAVAVAGGSTVGQRFNSDSRTYLCDSYDPEIGYWMTNVADPTDRRNVSERAIGRTFHKEKTP